MNGENRFSTRDVIKTAWHNVKGTKWAIWAPQIVMALILFGLTVVFLIIGALTGIIPKPGAQAALGAGFFVGLFIFELIVIFLLPPLAVGIQMVALKRVRGETISASMGFKYWHKWIPLGLTVLFFTIGYLILNLVILLIANFLSAAGLGVLALLFDLVTIFVLLLYTAFFMFNMLFIADKNKGPWGALGHSAKMVAPHWFRVWVLMVFLGVVGVIILLPAVLGLLCPLVVIKILGVLVSIVLLIWGIPYLHLIIPTIFHRLSGNE